MLLSGLEDLLRVVVVPPSVDEFNRGVLRGSLPEFALVRLLQLDVVVR